MNLSKHFIAWFFILTGFAGGMLLGYMQINRDLTSPLIFWAYSFIYIGFLASWYMLFDYIKQREGNESSNIL